MGRAGVWLEGLDGVLNGVNQQAMELKYASILSILYKEGEMEGM
jgi:hypothetical protein